MRARRRGSLSRYLIRFAPFGSMVGLGALTLVGGPDPLTVVLGIGALWSGSRLLDRKGNERRELLRRVRGNVRELGRVAREDRVAAGQMKRIAALQEGILQSWELLGEEYGPLLQEDLYAIADEVGTAALLARRRAALRSHLQSVDRYAISGRIHDLEREISAMEEGSGLRASFEAALDGRRGELEACDGIPRAISAINAQLEAIEGVLANLRGDLLALDPGLSPYALEAGLVGIKNRVAYFRRGLDESTRGVEGLLAGTTEPERLPAR